MFWVLKEAFLMGTQKWKIRKIRKKVMHLSFLELWNIYIFFLFFHENVMGTHQGTSTEYPEHMFLWRNKKKKNKNTFIWILNLSSYVGVVFT